MCKLVYMCILLYCTSPSLVLKPFLHSSTGADCWGEGLLDHNFPSGTVPSFDPYPRVEDDLM